MAMMRQDGSPETKAITKARAAGQIRPGEVRNPRGITGENAGRPRNDAKALAAARTVEAVETLSDPMRSAKNENVRLSAAMALLDRGHGKPMQPVDPGMTPAMMEELERILEPLPDDILGQIAALGERW